MKSWLVRFGQMMELVRFSHTVFALPFAILSTLMALAVPLPSGESLHWNWRHWAGILLCMVMARTAAMAFNRLVDERLDAANPRTAKRHLPAGLIRRSEAIGLTIFCSVGFVASTLLFWPNWLPLAASLPVLVFLLGYSLAKRFTSASHLWLGIALSLAPICAWVAVRGEAVVAVPSDLNPALLLALALAFWVAGFDIIYACQDATFDRKAGLHSVPAKFGVLGALRIAAGLHAATVVVFAILPWLSPELNLGWLYYSAILGIGLLLLFEHWLVSADDLQRVGIAFFHVNAIISVVVLVAAGCDCLLG